MLEVEKFIPYRLRKKIGQFRINTKEVVYDSQQKSFINRIKPHPASLSTVKDAKKNAKVLVISHHFCSLFFHLPYSVCTILIS